MAMRLNLKAGEWVEVRPREEILATLDERGRLENLPFMPEMLQYCGQRFRVFKRADKTCDNIEAWSIRRMKDAVHLEGVRCDGSGHGGCEAICLIFWKEAWLKRAAASLLPIREIQGAASAATGRHGLCTVEDILTASQTQGEPIYTCQATELRRFTSFMRSWDPRQYVRDVLSGNLDSNLSTGTRAERVLEMVLASLRVFQSVTISLFNRVQQSRHGAVSYPFLAGTADTPPVGALNLQPGELVKVRSKEEIMANLGKNQRNRGLWFDPEMLPFCGGIYRVMRRVHQIIDEKTGKMIQMKYPCIVLEGVVCKSDYHRFCPRAIHAYWRESWLERPSGIPGQGLLQQVAADSCDGR